MSLNITSIIPSEIQKLEDEMRSLTEMILKEFSQPGKINLKLVTNEEMTELNHKFRDKNKTTNVLAFPNEGLYSLDDEIGDIALNVECLEKESKEQGKELRSHFLHLLAHGILHLLGETHYKLDDERKMEALEIDFLKRLNITNPYKI